MDKDPGDLSLSAIIAGGWLSDADSLELFAQTEWCLAQVAKDEKLYDLAGDLRKTAKVAGLLATAARTRYDGTWGEF